MSGFYHKHFLELLDFTPAELSSLLQLAARLKADKKSGKGEVKLASRNVALILEEGSIRAQCLFEVAAYDQGARVTHLDPSGSQIGHRELIRDATRVLGHIYDGIQYHDYGQEIVETLAKYTGAPVWSGLINGSYPTQLLTGLPTIQEHSPGEAFNEMTLVYAGSARNNIGNSMFETAALTGLNLRLVAPQVCWPEVALVTECRTLAQQDGGNITLTEDVVKGVEGADFIYTDVQVSMGEAKERQVERIVLLRDYQVNSKMMQLTGSPEVKFLHCLPAFHDDQATLDKKMAEEFGLYGGMEVTDEVFKSAVSIVFDQAENRMHTIKAVMVVTLSK